MAKEASTCLFISLLFLLVICSYAEVGEVAALYVEASTMVDFVSSRRKLFNSVKRTSQHDVILPPNIVTVPATNPANTPAPIPTTTPVTVPSTDPNNPTTVPVTIPITTPAPVAVPGAGAQQPVTTYPTPTGGVPVSTPVTNPVTTYPAPTGGVPVSTPVTNPVPNPVPPATTNAPAAPGQSWCIARTGASETTLQSALDYACGTGGADCSQIQQGGNCYNPNSLQNHASYAFNSYYQKNAAPTSCDFGGAATIVNTNPSTGSCIYPSSGSQSTPTATPATTTPTSTTEAGVPGSVTPPSVLNSSTPGSSSATSSVFGSDTPPDVSTSTSMSVGLQPTLSRIILLTMTSFVARLISESSTLL
ncbi:mucin-2-like isoform X2 [Hibiscus syriacus]|uniref:mucin-2-like isoform X2 n=1 Tax=Hibiscus syriacus TaxID=106335 RepID=UPI001920B3E5|nr:mucin-2-like isoform X2 [Hibiscus syriacus]